MLIDCGLYQGAHELEADNVASFGFDAPAIDYVLLTHAHLDHCGRLPLLVKRGFRGEIIATPATRELARLVLLDAAHLQEDEAEYQARRAARGGNSIARPPLYTTLDALHTMDSFGRVASYGVAFDVAPGVRATFLDAGHILGSATIYLELNEGVHRRSVAFSGDLGNCGRPLLRDPVAPPNADLLVMETTYGDHLHKPLAASVEELYQAIEDTFRRGVSATDSAVSRVKCNGFSAHADQAELLAWQRKINAPRTFLVHGEEEVMRQFAGRLRETATVMPSLGEAFEL